MVLALTVREAFLTSPSSFVSEKPAAFGEHEWLKELAEGNTPLKTGQKDCAVRAKGERDEERGRQIVMVCAIV